MLKEIIIALQSYKYAYNFIKSNKLFKWIITPGIFYCILFAIGIYFFTPKLNDFIEWLNLKTGLRVWLEKKSEAGEWWGFLFTTSSVSLWCVMALFYFSLFKYFILITGSPIFAHLSEKTVAIIEGKNYFFSFSKIKSDVWRGARVVARNLLRQSIYMVALTFASVIPVFGLLAVMVALFLDSYYFGFSMLDYGIKQQDKKMNESFFYIESHKGLAVGNGIIFYLMHWLPIAGWIFAPAYSVIAATLTLHPVIEKKEEKENDF